MERNGEEFGSVGITRGEELGVVAKRDCGANEADCA